MEAWLLELIGKRSAGSHFEQQAWVMGLGKLNSFSVGRDDLIWFMRACPSATWIHRVFVHLSIEKGQIEAPLAFLRNEAGSCSVSDGDFLAAVGVLANWLAARDRKTTLQVAIGFMACCEEAFQLGMVAKSLAHAVVMLLDEHGFDG